MVGVGVSLLTLVGVIVGVGSIPAAGRQAEAPTASKSNPKVESSFFTK